MPASAKNRVKLVIPKSQIKQVRQMSITSTTTAVNNISAASWEVLSAAYLELQKLWFH